MWQTVNHKKYTVSVGHREAQGGSAAALYPTPAVKPSDSERQILISRAAGAAAEKWAAPADIALEVNKAVAAGRVPAHIRIQWLAYNEKGNLSGLMGAAATSSMVLPQQEELLLRATRKYHPEIIDVIRVHRWHRLRVHRVDLDRYGRQLNGM